MEIMRHISSSQTGGMFVSILQKRLALGCAIRMPKPCYSGDWMGLRDGRYCRRHSYCYSTWIEGIAFVWIGLNWWNRHSKNLQKKCDINELNAVVSMWVLWDAELEGFYAAYVLLRLRMYLSFWLNFRNFFNVHKQLCQISRKKNIKLGRKVP